MARRRATRRRVLGTGLGSNLIVIAGLPRDTLAWITRILSLDTAQGTVRHVGAPAPQNDWGDLYKKSVIKETLKVIEEQSLSNPPKRIIVLYVHSRDSDNLLSVLAPVCFLLPLESDRGYTSRTGSEIEWRHHKPTVRRVIYQAIEDALRATDALKAEITDKRISAYTLPSRNFYYPDSQTTINDIYCQLAQRTFNIRILIDELSPTRFDRNQLPARAFKGRQHTDRFFQDRRGRVFPPDLYHGSNRGEDEVTLTSEFSLSLHQRYRFGVTVRDGNLHYDVQYERPRMLINEPMYCAAVGNVRITASHANVGVNDVIWAPDGKKVPENK